MSPITNNLKSMRKYCIWWWPVMDSGMSVRTKKPYSYANHVEMLKIWLES